MKPPSVPVEEKWTAGAGGDKPVAAPVGAGDAWLPVGKARRRPSVEPSLRQRQAVEAYCRELCAPDAAPTAVAEAVSSYGVSAARLGQRASADDKQRVLQGATRLAAASHAPVGNGGSGWRWRVVDALTAERDVGCRSVPVLLARRENGDMSRDDDAALRDHLRECLRCRATEVRMARAERAFVAVSQLGVTLPTVTGPAEVAPAKAAPVEAAPIEPAAATAASGAWTPPPLAPAPAADPPADPASEPPPPRRGRRLGPIPVAAAVGVLAVGGVGAAAALSTGSSGSGPGAASTPSAPSVASAPATPAHHRHIVHHRAHTPKPKHKHKPRPKPTPVNTVASTTPSIPTLTTGGTGNSGAVGPSSSSVASSAPVAPSPPPSSSGTSSGTSSGGGSAGGSGGGSDSASSATIQQPSLGATSAPTQGIGNQP